MMSLKVYLHVHFSWWIPRGDKFISRTISDAFRDELRSMPSVTSKLTFLSRQLDFAAVVYETIDRRNLEKSEKATSILVNHAIVWHDKAASIFVKISPNN